MRSETEHAEFRALRERLVERHAGLPRRLQQVARYVLEHPDDMALGTVAEVARGAGVQPSTLVRFAQALGYSGFSGLQQVFRTRLRERWPEYRERLDSLRAAAQAEGGAATLLAGFVDASVTSLARLRDSVSTQELDRAAAALAGARTIYLLGQRRAFPIASYLAYACAKLGLRAVLLDNVGGLLTEQAGLPEPGDALLAISFTPYTPSTVEMAAAAARRGVAVVAITDSDFSPLVPMAKAWLEVVEADSGAFRSLAASFAVALTLAVLTAERRQESAPAGDAAPTAGARPPLERPRHAAAPPAMPADVAEDPAGRSHTDGGIR
ncbi:MurR/RpiR family transcriptional regulator [Roseomonas sp. OT10]|uniref:MurR/RpiR family transcriptional regulator n=1 Tax=Roseomonas cutis TaxID=2897332 RepID=UPI001E2EFEEC|nr:MurR/RpiR family transcriptional regulator [Roseomonas sp. OT10]UFN47594.1 MurR/RpiR family transcriptional regulator [Roseomonas sp. OT10]